MNWYFASGDLGYFWNEQLRAFSWLPEVFDESSGFGISMLPSLWLNYPFRFLLKLLSFLGLSWFVIEKLLWFGMFALALYSSWKFAEFILGKSKLTLVAPVIYVINSYLILLFSGGQLGVAYAYAFAPFVILRFLSCRETYTDVRTIWPFVVNGLVLSLLIVLDLRLAYIVLVALLVHSLVRLWLKETSIVYVLTEAGVTGIVAFFVHAFWLLPVLLGSSGVAQLGEELTSPDMLRFLSVADFSHSLSLLHPNWPENLFGKVYFMRPEFLLTPFIAFIAVLFTDKNKRRSVYVLSFFLLILLGAFLSKGIGEPFGDVYRYMFMYVPGFVMFRDPTKWYVCTALGYAIVIPYVLMTVAKKINVRYVKSVVVILFIGLWGFTLRDVFLGNVKGNIFPLRVHREYKRFKDVLIADSMPSRVLWMPRKENFAYQSRVHPLLDSNALYKNASQSSVLQIIPKPEFLHSLKTSGIGYVVVPIDTEKRIFMKDYAFDLASRNRYIQTLDKTQLVRVGEFQNLVVYKNNTFIMTQSIPENVIKQQRLSYVGLVLSVVSLGICGLVIWRKRKV
jgi:hypothetical protein